MKIDEFSVLVKGMKAVYNAPWFLPDNDSIKIWFNLLKDIEYQVANIGVQKWMMTHRDPPTIADIREICADVKAPKNLEWGEAWEKVREAVHCYGSYRECEALESLDEITREATKCVGFRDICLSENIAVERANFRQIYESLVERKKNDMQISPKMHEMIGMIQNNNLLKGE